MKKYKKGQVYTAIPIIVLILFFSVLYLSISLLMYASTNDYLFYPLQNVSQDLVNQSIISIQAGATSIDGFERFDQLPASIDLIWFSLYLAFVISTCVLAYKTNRTNYFSAFVFLLYGIIAMLFVLTIVTEFTNWWYEDILLAMLPTAFVYLPLFLHVLEYVGIYSAIHIVAMLLLNLIDFDFAKQKFRKDKEQTVIDNEVL